MPECEALSQEITALRNAFGGDLIYLNPNQRSPIYLPRLAFGFHKLRQIRRLEAHLDIHHIYNPDAFPFPILRQFKRPVVYTISSGVGTRRPDLKFFSAMAAIAVADERSLARLNHWGLGNVHLVRPGIDVTRFTSSPMQIDSEIRLLIASAPWTNAQFQSKGVDALLEAARLNSRLRLIFLWRGVLFDEMLQRVQRMKLGHQVDVINKQVDVNRTLANVHASVALAAAPGIIKSYPHSLLDSLAAGKPVLVSRAIPMSDYVEKYQCGQVVENVTAADILPAIETLAQNYPIMQRAAQVIGQRDFSEHIMAASYQTVYETALNKKTLRNARD